jgi:hypothetical protein
MKGLLIQACASSTVLEQAALSCMKAALKNTAYVSCTEQ